MGGSGLRFGVRLFQQGDAMPDSRSPRTTQQTTQITRRTALGGIATGLAGGVLPALASDAYPSRPVTMVVPYTAGGSTDVVARLIAQKLSENLGQTFVVDNRGGANGVIGMEIAARAEPNGYTLLMNTAGAQALTPVLYKTKFHALDSWEPISLISTIPLVIVAREGLPVKNFAEFVQLARAGNPPLSSSSGSSMIVLVTSQLKRVIGAPTMINAQYKGTSEQAQALVKGEVDVSVDSFVTMPHIKAGKVRPLAVIAPQRVASLPDVPTLAELGVKDMEFASWSGLLAPKGTPKPIVDRLSAEVQKIVRTPEVQERLRGFDHTPVGGNAADFAKLIGDDYARWQRVVKDTGFKIEG
jgi:tripartite-type tricarboxylate transporter receptor subunit TctC